MLCPLFKSRYFLPTLLVIALAAVAGCAGSSDKTAFMESQENVAFGANELRVRLYDYAANFAGAVEQTADDIAAATDDPVIRRRTIRWKSSASAEIYRAAFGPDPLGAFSDVFAFSKQQLQFFESGAGSELFAEWQPQVVATARILERRAHALGLSGTLSGDISPLESKLDPWVREHPLQDLNFIRESTTPFWAEYITNKGGGLQSVSRMEDSLHDMVSRLDILTENLRKQARWETELLLEESLTTGELAQFMARVDSMDVNIDRIRVVLDDLEPILNRQIQALMVTGGELTERERQLILEFWAVERDIIFARIDGIQNDVFERLAAERALIMAEIEASADKTVGTTLERSKAVVDHLVWRLAQLFAACFLVLGLCAVLALRIRNRQA